MQLYNSLTGRKKTFTPRRDTVTLYVCGITPYDTTHLGHAATYCAFDVLVRILEHRGSQVRYVQNVTDIDDDILREGRKRGEDWQALGNRWTAHFIEDMASLNVRPPDVFPRATEVIEEIVQVVGRLIEAGVAYEAGGSVYFDLDTFQNFGDLSRIPHSEMLPIANERGNVPNDPNKRHPLDFILWQKQKEGEPAWESPWGAGRPGWHIECSTLAEKYLGERVDIHGGGADLIFPHHEGEIAQAESATGVSPFVRCWMHTAMVELDGVKMSKSLGNLVMVRDLLQHYTPDALRLYLASHHYRIPWGYSEEALRQAAEKASQLQAALRVDGGSRATLDVDEDTAAVLAALEDDLDTPEAVDGLMSLAARIESAAADGRDVRPAQESLRTLGALFGLRLDRPQPEASVIAGWNRHLQRFAN